MVKNCSNCCQCICDTSSISIFWYFDFLYLILYLFLYRAQNSLISIYRHYTIDIADPNSMLDACHMNFVIDLAHHELSVVRRSEVRFLMGTPNFFCPTPVKRWKTSFSTCWYCFSRFGTFYRYRCFQFVARRPDSCLKFWASVAEFWRNSVIIDILENKSMFSLTKYTVIYFPLRPT